MVRLSRSKKFCATFAPAPVNGVDPLDLSEGLVVPVVLVAPVEVGDRWIEGDVVVLIATEVPKRCARIGATV